MFYSASRQIPFIKFLSTFLFYDSGKQPQETNEPKIES